MNDIQETRRAINELVDQYNLPVLRSTFEMTDKDVDRYSTKKNHRFSLVVVFNSDGEFLVLKNSFRDWGWELPGGNVEPSENYIEAAKREALEEAGVVIKNLVPICIIQADIVSPSYRLESLGVGFSTVWSGDFVECEKETTIHTFTGSIPEGSKFVNADVIRIALSKFDWIKEKTCAAC